MNELEIPIFKKTYELYKLLHVYRSAIPKQDRFTLWQSCENTTLDLLENLFLIGEIDKNNKLFFLKKISAKLNLLRILVRLTKDTKAIDLKKYVNLESIIDEIGRMLGGWIKASKY